MRLEKLKIEYEKASVEIPYYIFEGKVEGPKVFISGGIHGNETNGIHLVKKFVEKLVKDNIEETLKGTLYVIPVLNMSAFEAGQRYTKEDNLDLNRCFGLLPISSLSHQIAATLTEKIFSKCEFGIDCHDSGNPSVLLPHSRVHKCEPLNCTTVSKQIGQLFGTQIIMEREGLPNMLSIYLKDKFNISVLTVETGGAEMLFPEYIAIGLRGLNNVLIAKGMIKGKIILPQKQFLLTDRLDVTALMSGIVELNINLGDSIKKDQIVGSIYYPQLDKEEDLIAPLSGLVLSRWQYNQITPGRTLYSILSESEKGTTYHELKMLDSKKINM